MKYFLLIITLFLSSCSFKNNQPSVLIIGVESLGFNQIVCGQKNLQNKHGGFKQFCDGAVRFTHAYAPSTMSQASIASILTAKNPQENGLWDNGNSFIPAETEIISELALKKGFKTAFFSGGAPILKKSGLGQGFEKFDDKISLTPKKIFRGAKNNFQLFLKWREKYKEKFFSLIYLNDLLFPNQTTKNNAGEVRNLSYQSQLSEIDESLGFLIKKMKQQKIWDSTTVILVGLNGQSSTQPHRSAVQPLNLFSQNLHVPFFIKPSHKKRDLPINWTINKNVSLTDLGATLFDLLEAPLSSPPRRLLDISSLKSVLISPQVTWDEDRLILLESAWPIWRGLSNSQLALKKGHFLIVYNNPIEIYNSLIDQNESTKLQKKDPLYAKLANEAQNYFNQKGYSQNIPPAKQSLNKISLAKQIWSNPGQISKRSYKSLRKLVRNMPWDDQLSGWLAKIALSKNHWNTLDNIGAKTQNPFWSYVARLNQGKPTQLFMKKCFSLFTYTYQSFKKPNIKECPDELLIKAVDWTLEKDRFKKNIKQARFLRLYNESLTSEKINAYNFTIGLRWDTDIQKPKGPLLADLFLALPKNKAYLKQLKKLIKD